LHEEKTSKKETLYITTIQEKNITFPTNSKLPIKMITHL